MPANDKPIWSKAPDIQWIAGIATANNNTDLTSGTNYLVFTADATNGGFVSRIRWRPAPANNTTATAARVWLNNGSTPNTAANSTLWDEQTLPAVTANAAAAVAGYELPLNFGLVAGFKIYVTVATGTNAWFAAVIGGIY